MKIINIQYTGFGGVSGVVNGMVTAPGAEKHEWVMGYYGVAPLDPSHSAFCSEHGFCHASFHPQPRKPWKAWHELGLWLVAENPDAIICHSSTAIPPCAWAALRCKAPLIAVEHTPNEVKSRSEWLGSRAGMFLADRVVVLTDVYTDLLAAGLDRSFRFHKICRIPNGVDAELFYPNPVVETSSRPLRAGMAARLAHSKCHDLLIDVAPDLNVKLEFAGDGECKVELQALAATLPDVEVVFRGLVPSGEMPNWMRGLDIYLHASNGETFSMSILQAMASGLPIIASDISGMDEILGRDESCGLLVSNTPESWREAVQYLVNNPELRYRMGKAARKRAVTLFSTKSMLNGYLTVIGNVIQEKAA